MSAITGGFLGGIIGAQVGSNSGLVTQAAAIVILTLFFTSFVAGYIYMKKQNKRGFALFDIWCGFSLVFFVQAIALCIAGLIWVAVFGG